MDEGEIKIAYIISESAAFKNGELKEDHTVLSLISGGDFLEAFCVSITDILAFINDSDHKTISFKIKNTVGTIKNVQLTKAVIIEKNSVSGYILENSYDLGYIKVDSFYNALDSPNGSGVANDFAKELFEFSQKNIKDLLIDSRSTVAAR